MTQRAFVRAAFLTMVVVTTLLWQAAPSVAQGVTTAAISGCVTDTDGNPVENIVVEVRNGSTGVTRGAVSGADCRFFVPGLQVGGPYTVTASGLGYETTERTAERLTLGQNLALDFQLQSQAVELAAVNVVLDPTVNQLINPSRTGAEQLVSQHLLDNLPTVTRNFTDFIQLSPLVGSGGGATSVGNQNNRFNNIQIDGVVTQDNFGLGATGQPGGQANARSITIEAVKEFQILVAPFDVRQSGFTGGLINAVTKTGTNEWEASGSYFYKNEDFIRENLRIGPNDVKFGEFKNDLWGATLGGPIVHDRIHFFSALEFEQDERPSPGIAIGREDPSETGVNVADAEQFADLLEAKGVDPGSIGARTVKNPNTNLFGRIDAQLTPNHALTFRLNRVNAEDDNVQDRTAGGAVYSLESNGYFFESTTYSYVGQLNSTFGSGFFNELTGGYSRIRDSRTPETNYPVIEVLVPRATGTGTKALRAGAEFFSQGNELDQDSWEITDNLSFSRGDHRITLGIHDESFKFRNLFDPGRIGQWNFSSLEDFANNNPNQFIRNVPFEPGVDTNARFTVNQLGLYGQTEWSGIPNVVLTAGLRYDVPFVLDDPAENPAFEEAFGRTTSEVASGNGVVSPRLGFNWDVNGEKTTQVRGGVGIFTGRHPYVWLSNLYTNTGLLTVNISCRSTSMNVPTFTLDPDNQPETCAGTGIPAPPLAAVNVIDPDFQYPHNWRFNLAVDQALPWGIVGTAEFLYTKSRKQIFLRELNVDFDDPVSVTQGGRPVFGTHKSGVQTGSNNTIATPNRISTGFLQVVELGNSEEDRTYSLTFQAQKRYSDRLELNTSYTFSDAEDISGLTSSIATSNIGFNPVKGNPNDPERATSDYETRHKFVLGGSYDVANWFTWSLFWVGTAGDKYSYTYDGDVNADGYEAPNASNRNNDLLYVPTGPEDITLVDPAAWTNINAYIESEDCLRDNRGQILSRNICEEPWRNRVDTRFTFRIPTVSSQNIELTLDILNVLNMLNEDWGLNEGVQFQTIDLLVLQGWDDANNRGIFQPAGGLRLDESGNANPFQTFDPSSRWQAQVGLKYAIN